ncbi:MAG: purine phosphorylase [Microcystaceae cyanobacterium]
MPSSSQLLPPFDFILGVKGAEYRAISHGFAQSTCQANLLAIPAGLIPVGSFLTQQFQFLDSTNKLSQGVLLMGLSGGLWKDYAVGEGILYQGCGYVNSEGEWSYLRCDFNLNKALTSVLGNRIKLGKGMSSDRIITDKIEKQRLGKSYDVVAIDMESFAVLAFFQERGIPVAILRVISDDVTQTLPDLSAVFDSEGNLKSFVLAKKMVQQPWGAIQLIRSSLIALKRLKQFSAIINGQLTVGN